MCTLLFDKNRYGYVSESTKYLGTFGQSYMRITIQNRFFHVLILPRVSVYNFFVTRAPCGTCYAVQTCVETRVEFDICGAVPSYLTRVHIYRCRGVQFWRGFVTPYGCELFEILLYGAPMPNWLNFTGVKCTVLQSKYSSLHPGTGTKELLNDYA